MENSRESTRSIVQELMNEVIEQGFHELVHRPQESINLNELILSATTILGEQLHQIDQHPYRKGSEELQHYWKSITNEAERVSLELLMEIQQIKQQHNPHLRRI